MRPAYPAVSMTTIDSSVHDRLNAAARGRGLTAGGFGEELLGPSRGVVSPRWWASSTTPTLADIDTYVRDVVGL